MLERGTSSCKRATVGRAALKGLEKSQNQGKCMEVVKVSKDPAMQSRWAMVRTPRATGGSKAF